MAGRPEAPHGEAAVAQGGQAGRAGLPDDGADNDEDQDRRRVRQRAELARQGPCQRCWRPSAGQVGYTPDSLACWQLAAGLPRCVVGIAWAAW